MDLETENRIAAILMKEAAELRREAARDGIDVYLRPPNVRGRPNSRFLTATVVGVQQSNRAVEVNEMWRAREKEKEMDNNSKSKSKRRSKKDRCEDYEEKEDSMWSSGELRDNEIEEFLHSRAKRGRGNIGSRMDETGPYLPASASTSTSEGNMYRDNNNNNIVGPLYLKSTSSEEKRSKHHCKKLRDKKKTKKREKKRSKHHK